MCDRYDLTELSIEQFEQQLGPFRRAELVQSEYTGEQRAYASA
jgi:hypothetical protein